MSDFQRLKAVAVNRRNLAAPLWGRVGRIGRDGSSTALDEGGQETVIKKLVFGDSVRGTELFLLLEALAGGLYNIRLQTPGFGISGKE